jgi:hypothetical protein
MFYYQSELNKVWESMERVPTAAATVLVAPNTDLERIQKLADLKRSGAITDEEFVAETPS